MKKTFFLLLALLSVRISFAQWTKIAAIPSQDIVALTQQGNIIFAASDTNIIYKNTDGNSWNPLIVSNNGINITAIKNIDNILYVGTNTSGIFISRNGGNTWENYGTNLFSISEFTQFNNLVYISTFGSGVAVFNPANNSCLSFNNQIPSYSNNVNTITNTQTDLLMAAGANGTYYRYDFTVQQWKEELYLGSYKPGLQIDKLLYESGTLYATNGYNLLISNNNGLTWERDQIGTHNGIDRKIYTGNTRFYTTTNLLNGSWLQQRDKNATAYTTWQNAEEFFEGKYIYDLLETDTGIYLARADGLYFKNIVLSNDDYLSNTTQLTIFPNPSIDKKINISSNVKIDMIEIYNIMGQLVYKNAINNNVFLLENNFQKGAFSVYITFANGKKLIRQIMN